MIGASQIKTYMAPRISFSGQLFYQLTSLSPIFELIWPSPSQMLLAPKDPPRFFTWQELNWLPVSFRGWHLTRCKGMGEINNDGQDQDSDPGYQNLLSGVLQTELSCNGNQAGLSHYSPLNGLNGHRSWRSPQAHSLAGVNLSVWGMGIAPNVTRGKK